MPLVPRQHIARPAFDAVVLAEGTTPAHRVAGLTLRERARRVALRLGAREVYMVDSMRAREALTDWWATRGDASVLVIHAADQVVHLPLIEPLLAAHDRGPRSVAVTPAGDYAGALLAAPEAAGELLTAIADPHRGDAAAAALWQRRDDVVRVEHGPIARAPAADARERRRAARTLEQIIHKSQDGPVTRWLYRPVSLLITRALLPLPVKPNHVSAVVALLGALGIWLAASADYDRVVLGSAVILIAGYIDGCDGEIARLKLSTSRLGAWLDTLTDEFTTVGYLIALGVHNYLRHPEPWVAGSIAVGTAAYLVSIAFVYYELIVVLGTANSQDYVGAYALDRERRVLVPVRPDPAQQSLLARVAPHIMRRDFINWAALLFAAAHLTWLSYAIMVGCGVAATAVLAGHHLRLRKQVRALAAPDGVK